jgi:paraquat-inducible protein B
MDFARRGAVFWIERAQISAGNISGLTTVISGPYIDGLPGEGPPALAFIGLDGRPVRRGPGITIALHAARLGHLERDSAVYFRGIQVGVVQDIQLGRNAAGVDIFLFIWQRYASIVRTSSEFWIENGINVSGGLFNGLKLNVESVRALLGGAIAFATPDDHSPQAGERFAFPLNDEPRKEWLGWSTNIPIPAETQGDDGRD